MIHYPFPYLVSPHAAGLQQELDDMLHLFTADEYYKQKLRSANFAYLGARAFPYTDYDRLRTFAKMALFFFVNDDKYDNADVDTLRPVYDRYMRLMRGEENAGPGDDPLCRLLAESRDELKGYRMSARWTGRFTDHFRNYLFSSLEENPYRNGGRYPALHTYLSWREASGAMALCLDYIEVALKKELPEQTFSHPVVQQLISSANRISILCNDIYSLPKDIAGNEVFNYALIYSHEHRTDIKTAENRLHEVHNQEVHRFLQLRWQLSELVPSSSDLEAFVDGLEKWMQANAFWMFFDSDRYKKMGAQLIG